VLKKTQHNLDRNYFLAYSHKLAFLLLLSAIALNTKFISVAIDNAELLYSTDMNNKLQPLPTCTPMQQPPEGMHVLVNENDGDNHKGGGDCYSSISHYSFPVTNSEHFLLSFPDDWNFTAVCYDKVSMDWMHNKNILTAFEKVEKFCINPSKLVDGFKFIIKIPDKLTFTLVK
jgi:hypothetical protein